MMMMNETTMARKMSERHTERAGKSCPFKVKDVVLIYIASWSGILSIYREPRGSIARLEVCRGRSDVMTDLSRRCCVWSLWMAGV